MLEKFRPLYIGIIAYNSKCAKQALRIIRDSNEEQVKNCELRRGILVFADGTVFRIISENDKGAKIDQLIVCDDYRWNVFLEQHDLIEMAKIRMMLSCVPDEYKLQRYEA